MTASVFLLSIRQLNNGLLTVMFFLTFFKKITQICLQGSSDSFIFIIEEKRETFGPKLKLKYLV